MEFIKKNISTVLLSIALIVSILVATGIFDDNDILIGKVEEDNDIEVYIVGEVKQPGIYTINKGCILNDLIELAGGLEPEVDKENINLAYNIDKNMMIKVLSTTMLEMEEETGIITYESELSKLMVDINTANIDDLILIPNIGEATANSIIKYREENGDFKTIEDIMNVTGIKEAKFEMIKDFICVK